MRRIRGRRRVTHVVLAAAVLVLTAVLIGVAAFIAGGSPSRGNAPAVPAAPAPVRADPAVVPVADTAPEPTRQGLAAALLAALDNPDLGRFGVRVADALTGDELLDRNAGEPLLPASTNKVLTAAAALLTLPTDARFTTTVTSGDRPGVVVLVGGGDPTLSAAPGDDDTWYRDAARISDLAAQVKATGVPARDVVVDTGAYTGPTMAPGWDPADIEGGDIAPMEAVMLDGGRTQPVSVDSARSTTPALDAGRALAVALGADPATVRLGAAPPDARRLAAVQSPPLVDRLRDMMNQSDNVMAESIGREVAAASGKPVSFAGATAAVGEHLRQAGVDLTGAVLVDSSGLSWNDRLAARTLDEVVGAAAGPGQPRLRLLLDALPIAGGSGTLSNRYHDTDLGRDAAGWLRAKTGSLSAVNALAGVVTDRSGRVLTFAIISNDAGPTGRTALDTLAATLRTCGCGQ
ncbi:D-alanyl-D-alanine carboxypeptidase/D-alanyl-D-alanine-endopeptidase [Mycobacterium sp. MYCO198283]|uniref:D-alanyl-D-alanine carboxypeptidase/D-alanyl-D-alanine endopeptidase n=1 Tax=Mycobacterium sp. MYCO198283 TaxID=2883505 RepID=UPI001E485294|nr:D-alanyl-D-alanine carboxypeptidase/D-alanyl-D-alanine-endopeptidase [Mycobacterium sp. MYCO198283]MCG5431466.1 D-alanyl-D-alanine carboxypeptidase/D-alanyl-D-alanine-endopeptidase [Mycobacterium sp. MYCO198283]